MIDMRNTIRVILGLLAAAALATGCVKTLNLHDTTMDEEYEPDKVSTFFLWKALQIDDVNVNGIDIKPYFDWFDMLRTRKIFNVSNGRVVDMLGFTPQEHPGVPFTEDCLLFPYPVAEKRLNENIASITVAQRLAL